VTNGKELTTGSIISNQTYGDMIKFNPHWHCIILVGGVGDKNNFYHILLFDIAELEKIIACLGKKNKPVFCEADVSYIFIFFFIT
jgi:hypothetical protein